VRWSAADSPCYAVRPLQDNQIVFREVSTESLRRERQPKIEERLNRLSQARLEANVSHLAKFPTRLSSSTHFQDASTWAPVPIAGRRICHPVAADLRPRRAEPQSDRHPSVPRRRISGNSCRGGPS